ncbi:MAG: type VII secretion protein EccCa [Mycobacteriaceae bacterium]
MGTTNFSRKTRVKAPRIPGGELNLEAPPTIPKITPGGLLQKLLPLVMVVAMVGMMALMFTSGMGRNPMSLMFPIMMLVSMLGMLGGSGRGGAKTAEVNEDRKDYLRYLEQTRKDVGETAKEQHKSLNWIHPDPSGFWTLVGTRRMWERRPADSDYCNVRVGIGNQRLATTLNPPPTGPIEDLDPVTSVALRRFIRVHSIVQDLPTSLSLRGFAALTIEGEQSESRALIRAMLCELALFHGPDQLYIAVVASRQAAHHWEWIKWLPHAQHPVSWDGAGKSRTVYASLGEAEEAFGFTLAERDKYSRTAPPVSGKPQIMIVLDGGTVLGTERLVTEQGIDSVTLIELGGRLGSIAARRGLQLEVVDGEVGLLGVPEGSLFARADALTEQEALTFARRIAPFRAHDVVVTGNETEVSSDLILKWPDLLNISDPRTINPDVVWRPRVGRDRLRVPIGIGVDGSPVEIDLKESAENGMGPHGLCIGATGSGKSEFLRTLVLGLIATHSPDALNLVLVDFKGGATFLGLDSAPHVAAVITNLAEELAMVARMKDALAGEMNRRQELLRASGNFANVTEYERARASGAPLNPLPALFIVVDEFSELLSQHPDFAELFVAIGRLGRSLHIHLLLASQRLEEGKLRGLDSHLSYRIGLKTFSANESRTVLGVPDAYHLPSVPGSGYLKCDSADLLRFNAAYVSGTYEASGPRAITATGDSDVEIKPRIFTAAPVPIEPVDIVSAEPILKEEQVSGTLLDIVVGRLSGHGNPAHEVWLPPLDSSPSIDQLVPRAFTDAYGLHGGLTVPIGLVDRPYEQRRDPFIVELSGAAGHVAIVGGPQSGKSTAIRTLVLSLAATHSPAQVQFYCLDFGGGSLTSLEHLPHVGSVSNRLDGDRVRRTYAEMATIVRTREARFRELGIDSMAEFRRRRAGLAPELSDDPFGDVFFIIDGWGALRQEFEALEQPIMSLAAQSLSFGVHIVVATSRWAEIRPALKDQVGTRIELKLGDIADSDVSRQAAMLVPADRPGRGITRDQKHFLIGLPRVDGKSSTEDLGEAVVHAVTTLSAKSTGQLAPPVRMLPERVSMPDLHGVMRRIGLNQALSHQSVVQVAIGIDEAELAPAVLNFGDQPHLLIFGDTECGKTALLRTLIKELTRTNTPDQAKIIIADFRRTMLGLVESDHLAGYAISSSVLETMVRDLVEKLKSRMPGVNVTQQQLRERSWWSGPEVYLVVDDYDLVATASGNPLSPLLDYLPHAKDLGFHLIVARRSGGASRALYEPIIARLRDLVCMGIVMSGSRDEGALIGTVKPSELPPGRANVITRANSGLIQVAWSEPL